MRNKGKVLVILGMMAFLANGDNYAAASMISNIATDLGIEVSIAAISVTSYMLSFGLFTILFGPLSDRFGKVRVINIAAFGTAVFSILGTFAFNLPSLAVFRGFNGLFGAGIFPVTMALVGDMYDDNNRQGAIAKVMAFGFLGSATATAIGGSIAYLSSWRFVYLTYGVAELILAVLMFKILKRDKPVAMKLDLVGSYKKVLSNYGFMRLVTLLFLVGFVILGSFTYSGVLLLEVTSLNVLQVGLLLAFFGVGTFVGVKLAPSLRLKLKHYFLVGAGVIGFLSLQIISCYSNLILLAIGFIGYGVAFIFLQSTLIAKAQEKLPHMKGTAMSLAAFNMFLGAAVGTQVNGFIMRELGTSSVFSIASFIILFVGFLASLFVANKSIFNRYRYQKA